VIEPADMENRDISDVAPESLCAAHKVRSIHEDGVKHQKMKDSQIDNTPELDPI